MLVYNSPLNATWIQRKEDKKHIQAVLLKYTFLKEIS